MGRVYRKKEEVEQFLIRGFVHDVLGFTIWWADWPDRPDAVLILRKGRTKKKVALEHTGYFCDTAPGECSPLTPIADFWKRVQMSLARRVGQRKQLADAMACVELKHQEFKGQADSASQEALARKLAGELVSFVERHPSARLEWVRYPPPNAWPPVAYFSGLPTLEQLVRSVRVNRCPDRVLLPRCSWECSNLTSGHIGLNLGHIRAAIEKKNKKAAKYDWRSAKEKWLLIAAAGSTISEHAGPSFQAWSDSELPAICDASPFDRIFFWERPRRWYKSLKPDHPIVTY